MGSVDHCKRRAAECVRLAEKAQNPESRTMLLQMAQTWLRLAEKAEDLGDK
jgi:hypothetical protein